MLSPNSDALLDDVIESMDDRWFGKYRALVRDNRDPESLGRVRVEVPAVMGESEVWAMPCVPYAGNGVGLFAIPDIGTGVWVEFEAGDPSFPIWTGCFWGDGQIPAGDAEPSIKFFRTAKLTFRVDDASGELLIQLADGCSIRMTSSEIRLEGSRINNKSGGKKTSLTSASFDVNDGALKVL